MLINPLVATLGLPLAAPAQPPAPDPQQVNIALEARKAVLKGMMDGGQVDDVKMTSDLSGKTGDNDYFSALGYDA